MDSAGESRDTCFFVNYKRGLTLPKTELDSMNKRKLTTKFEEEPFFVWKHKNDDANFSARIKRLYFLRIIAKNDISLEEIILLTLKD